MAGPKSNPCATTFVICDSEEETMEMSFFFFCNHARLVWFGSNTGYLSHLDRNMGIVDWWTKLIKLKDVLFFFFFFFAIEGF